MFCISPRDILVCFLFKPCEYGGRIEGSQMKQLYKVTVGSSSITPQWQALTSKEANFFPNFLQNRPIYCLLPLMFGAESFTNITRLKLCLPSHACIQSFVLLTPSFAHFCSWANLPTMSSVELEFLAF